MLFGKAGITAKALAERLVATVRSKVGPNARPPCDGGGKTKWNIAVRRALDEIGQTFPYDSLYIVPGRGNLNPRLNCEWCGRDLMWWADAEGRFRDALILVAEIELKNAPKDVEDDFVKLRIFKCPVKLLVFSCDFGKVKKRVEDDLRLYEQHVKGEEYLLVGFTRSGPRGSCLKIRHNRKLKKSEKFKWQDFQF